MNCLKYREYAIWDLLYEIEIRQRFSAISQVIQVILAMWDETHPHQNPVNIYYKIAAEKLNIRPQTIDTNIRNLIKSLWKTDIKNRILNISPDLTVMPNPKMFLLILLSELKQRYPRI